MRHIQNAKKYGVPVVVAVNQFATDTPAELEAVRQAAVDAGEAGWPAKTKLRGSAAFVGMSCRVGLVVVGCPHTSYPPSMGVLPMHA